MIVLDARPFLGLSVHEQLGSSASGVVKRDALVGPHEEGTRGVERESSADEGRSDAAGGDDDGGRTGLGERFVRFRGGRRSEMECREFISLCRCFWG